MHGRRKPYSTSGDWPLKESAGGRYAKFHECQHPASLSRKYVRFIFELTCLLPMKTMALKYD
eukprot:m.314576 g.314576  ORF g.314576 m.314576 type:complete len:62 (+) comp534994_c0_seq1:130-315(+)